MQLSTLDVLQPYRKKSFKLFSDHKEVLVALDDTLGNASEFCAVSISVTLGALTGLAE